MIVIKKVTKGEAHLREVTNKNMFLEEKVIDGKVYYMPIQLSDSEEICRNEYANVIFEECPDYTYAKFSDAEGKVKDIVNLETKSKLQTKYDSIAIQVLNGKTYIKDIDCSGRIRQVYIYENGKFYKEGVEAADGCYLKLCEFLGVVYEEVVDETGQKKEMLIIGEDSGWLKGSRIISAPYKVQEFRGKPYVIKMADKKAAEVILMTNRHKSFKSSFYEVGCEFKGCLEFSDGYAKDIDSKGVIRRVYDFVTDKELFPHYMSFKNGNIEFYPREGYAKYLDENGGLKGAYDFETKEIRKCDSFGKVTLSHTTIFN